MNERDYQFEPVEVTTFRKKRGVVTDRAPYMVTPVGASLEDSIPDAIRDTTIMREVQNFEETLGFNQAQDNIDAAGQHQYYVELLFVVDYSTYRRYILSSSRFLKMVRVRCYF